MSVVPNNHQYQSGDGANLSDSFLLYPTGATALVPMAPTYLLTPNRIFVGGFPLDTTEIDLKKHFEQFYDVKEVKIIKSPSGHSKGYGFVTFETEEEAHSVTKVDDPNKMEKLHFRNRTLNIGPAIRKIESPSVSNSYVFVTPTGEICGAGPSPQVSPYGFPMMSPGVQCYSPQQNEATSPRFEGKQQTQFNFPPNGSYASIVSKGSRGRETNPKFIPQQPSAQASPTNFYQAGDGPYGQFPPPQSQFVAPNMINPSGDTEAATNTSNKENLDVSTNKEPIAPLLPQAPVQIQPQQFFQQPPNQYMFMPPPMFPGNQFHQNGYPQHFQPHYNPEMFYQQPYRHVPYDPYRQNFGMAAYAGTDVHLDGKFPKLNVRDSNNNYYNRYDRNKNGRPLRGDGKQSRREFPPPPPQVLAPNRTLERKPSELMKTEIGPGVKGGSFNGAKFSEGFKKSNRNKGFQPENSPSDMTILAEKLENLKVSEEEGGEAPDKKL